MQDTIATSSFAYWLPVESSEEDCSQLVRLHIHLEQHLASVHYWMGGVPACMLCACFNASSHVSRRRPYSLAIF